MPRHGQQYVFLYDHYHDELLAKDIGPIRVVSAAILGGYNLMFAGYSMKHKWGGVATIRPAEDGAVIGLIYRMDCSQVGLLDAIYDVHSGKVTREVMTVTDPRQRKWRVLTYQRQPTEALNHPHRDYYEHHTTLLQRAYFLYYNNSSHRGRSIAGESACQKHKDPCHCFLGDPLPNPLLPPPT